MRTLGFVGALGLLSLWISASGCVSAAEGRVGVSVLKKGGVANGGITGPAASGAAANEGEELLVLVSILKGENGEARATEYLRSKGVPEQEIKARIIRAQALAQ